MAQVRREVKAVTTRSPLLRREMIIHPLAPLARRRRHSIAATRAARLTLNERFHLKTLPALSRAPTTTRIARMTNARGGLSVGAFRRNFAIDTVAFDKERLPARAFRWESDSIITVPLCIYRSRTI